MEANTTPYTIDSLPEILITYSCSIQPNQRIQIRSSKDANTVFRQIWQEDTIEYKEQFYVLCLSRNNQVLGYFLHSVGGLSGTIVDIKQILAVALKANAASIILCHNHPSGSLSPSVADRDITRKITEGASLMDVTVLDHLILTETSYYSFADEGTLSSSDTYNMQKVEEYRK